MRATENDDITLDRETSEGAETVLNVHGGRRDRLQCYSCMSSRYRESENSSFSCATVAARFLSVLKIPQCDSKDSFEAKRRNV